MKALMKFKKHFMVVPITQDLEIKLMTCEKKCVTLMRLEINGYTIFNQEMQCGNKVSFS